MHRSVSTRYAQRCASQSYFSPSEPSASAPASMANTPPLACSARARKSRRPTSPGAGCGAGSGGGVPFGVGCMVASRLQLRGVRVVAVEAALRPEAALDVLLEHDLGELRRAAVDLAVTVAAELRRAVHRHLRDDVAVLHVASERPVADLAAHPGVDALREGLRPLVVAVGAGPRAAMERRAHGHLLRDVVVPVVPVQSVRLRYE